MNDREQAGRTGVLRRMETAMNGHDLDALADCFTDDFHSDLPIHPRRSFTGREQMRNNWAFLFAHVPDLAAEVLQSVTGGDQVWSEWEIHGTTVDGTRYLSRGVAIMWLHEERVASVRFYLDDVDPD
ncbi:SnoaL-like domain-containing protein [Micromonospora phaseoli]|uniref:SnoaL-like domain-containing protein n=1 Tax=Micromonospora phaseoli TaxID=1144548 RepID=A0A1H7CAG0_9ACTN|nr:nuclear transport factor 2 family protein [Micromonospora phaseoli]PZV92640.1 SnoaL-like protein [Micromonospora phaseoli]SEJ84062.1 SnoaL-like domain-containing protein [Micromonospora phaseoli]